MVFPFAIAIDAAEVRNKAVAPAFAGEGVGVMLVVAMLALALGLPGLNVETLSSRQPVLA